MNTLTVDFHQNNFYRLKFLKEAVYEAQIIKAFEKFRSIGIEPILIKGWAIARFYPVDKHRYIGDIDLCVDPSQHQRALQLLAREPEFNSLEIDLHRGLRHLDKLSFENLLVNSELVERTYATIRVLRAEDNLRVTCVHWLNDGGANQERLWDIYYLVANRPANFDWERCLDVVGPKRRRWIVCAIALAHRYLNLKLNDTPLADEIGRTDILPEWLLSALEKEWSDPVKLDALSRNLSDWKSFRSQLRKRFPPNPIQASIETEAPFDESSRLPYQIVNFNQRFFYSLNRLLPAVRRNFKV